jgi:fused
MRQMLRQDQQQNAFLLQKFSQAATLAVLRDLIDVKMPKKGFLSLVNGINFGCPHQGYYDHAIVFFQAICTQFIVDQRMNTERRAEFLVSLQQAKMDDMIMSFLMNVSSKADVSPLGVLAALQFIHDQVEAEQLPYM